jgi:hypothetical protein
MPGCGGPERRDAEAWPRAKLGVPSHGGLLVRMGIWLDGVEVKTGARASPNNDMHRSAGRESLIGGEGYSPRPVMCVRWAPRSPSLTSAAVGSGERSGGGDPPGTALGCPRHRRASPAAARRAPRRRRRPTSRRACRGVTGHGGGVNGRRNNPQCQPRGERPRGRAVTSQCEAMPRPGGKQAAGREGKAVGWPGRVFDSTTSR